MSYLRAALSGIMMMGVLGAVPAVASTSNVSSPGITEGAGSMEARFGFQRDDDSGQDQRYRQRLHIDYGFTDWYGLRLIVNHEKRGSQSVRYTASAIENKFQLFAQDVDGLDGGFRVSYSFADGAHGPDQISVPILLLKDVGDWQWRHNTVVGHEVGEDSVSGISLQTRWQGTYALEDGMRVGAEMFNRWGNLRMMAGWDGGGHQLGPVVKGKIPDTSMGYQFGYLSGISDNAPDHAFKFFVTRKF